MSVRIKCFPTQRIGVSNMGRSRWKWGKTAVHMCDLKLYEDGIGDSICWVKSRRTLSLTFDRDRVTCKFCIKILEKKNEKR